MMEMLFLFCWTGLFIVLFFFILKKNFRFRAYMLLILNLIFLSGIFYFYPLPNPSVTLKETTLNSEKIASVFFKNNFTTMLNS